MTARYQNGFLLSAGLHAAALTAALLLGYAASLERKPPQRILELVAGEGDNFGATVAPALGTPGGVKLDLPKPATPKVQPVIPQPEPAPVEATPVKPEPAKVTTPPAPVTKQGTKAPPTMAQDLRRKLWRAEARGKEAAAKERVAEQARLAKEEQAKARSQVKHIDAEGIAKGVVGGSTENKVGGAGGKALTSSGGTEMEMYFAMLIARVREAWEKPGGVSDSLVAEAEFRVAADGSISGVRLIKRSGSGDFDRAVVEAFSRVTMPKRPDGRGDTHTLEFRGRDK
ncbi:MAG: TonB C-terminal domain-containing protein [Verrucomicrobia bacterium]|nr:TonB C-terminal domain-containing protein [Verrucomicrobiota bacterium]